MNVSAEWLDAPCGLLRVDADDRVVAINTACRELCGLAADAPAPARIVDMLRPASHLYYQLSIAPALSIEGCVEEMFLELRGANGEPVPVLANIRVAAGATPLRDWAVLRVEQRGRWESAVVEARQEAERAKAELERVLAELRQSKWMLSKIAEVLPTCMYCGRVKSGQGTTDWQSAIDYLKQNSGFLSHGCCPTCLDRLRKDMNVN